MATVCARPILLVLIGAVSSCFSLHVSVPDPGSPLAKTSLPEGCEQQTKDMPDKLADIWKRQAPLFLSFQANATQCGMRCFIDNFPIPSTPKQVLDCQEGCQKTLTTYAKTSQKIFNDTVDALSHACTFDDVDADLPQGVCDCIGAHIAQFPTIEQSTNEALTEATAGLFRSSSISLPEGCEQKTKDMPDMLADIWKRQAPLFQSFQANATQCGMRCFIDNFSKASTPKQVLDCQEGCQKTLTTYAKTSQKIFEDTVDALSKACTVDDVDAALPQGVCDCIGAHIDEFPTIEQRFHEALTEATAGLLPNADDDK